MLTGSSRRGFTLVELMLSLVMLSLVSGALYQLLLSSGRLSRLQAQRIALQANVRGAAQVVASELRELDPVTDIISLGSHAVSYRAMRGFGYTCQALPAGSMRIARAVFTGHRDPQAGRDSVLVYAPGVLASADSAWTALALASVSASGACPGAAGAAITLGIPGAAAVIPAGTPVRIYEPTQLASYQSEGRFWLGMRSLGTGEAIQPLFGPLADGDGFRLDFAAAGGLPTAVPAGVRSITLSLRAMGDPDPQSGVAPAESVLTQIGLKNGSN